ncbi:2808_t:CDS:2 [Acaulospora morrowiae]|uniref:2808_t:CDS:1 n=1 Tax=Acaulospora morrowiae TaxID=94023 RepID=A0A9N9CMP2_9GLOM|nr:2808_t:CDS:2 [Acaulospora morrowiae]
MRKEFYTTLSQDFSQLLEDSDDYNVNIKVGENVNTRNFLAHSAILRARSPYFKRALSDRWTVKKDGIISFTKSNISPSVFSLILKYIYSGILDLTEIPGTDCLNLLVASDELLLGELIEHIQDHFIERDTTWTMQNFSMVLRTATQIPSCKKLQDYCFESICNDPEPFFTSDDFLSLDMDILLDLIKCDNLEIKEADIWEFLIKWAINHTQGIREMKPTDVKKFSENNFRDLKKTVEPFIPYVRFYDISLKEFYYKVRPYQQVIPEPLLEDLMSVLMADTEPKLKNLPARAGNLIKGSNIITGKHACIISNWIDKKDALSTSEKHQLQFNLLYRGTSDGFNAASFHEKVDNRGKALVVIKLKDSEKIIGGFNASGWYGSRNTIMYGRTRRLNDYGSWLSNSDHFIFSFANRNDYKTRKIGRSDDAYGVYDTSNKMLQFGCGDLMLDNGQYGTCKKNNYDHNILDTENFVAEELEVFEVISPMIV